MMEPLDSWDKTHTFALTLCCTAEVSSYGKSAVRVAAIPSASAR